MVEDVKVNIEYQVLCPPLTSEEYESLRESIRSEGLWVPLVINTDYEILDGNHRHRACEEVGRPWDDPKPIMKRFGSKLLEKKFVIETNLKRRQLTTLQRVEMAMKLEPIESELARQRMSEAGKIGRDIQLGVGPIDHTPKFEGKTRDIVARKVGLSGKTFQRGKKVLEEAPEELKKWVEEGSISVSRAHRIINGPVSKKRFIKILDKAPEELKEKLRLGKISINHAYLKIIQQERHEGTYYDRTDTLPTGMFAKQKIAQLGPRHLGPRHIPASLGTDDGNWRADLSPEHGHIVDLGYAANMAHNSYFSRLERIKQSFIWNYLYDFPDDDITRFVAKVNSKARERVEYVANHLLIMHKENREIMNRKKIHKDKVEELYAKFKQVTVEFTDGTTLPLNLKLLDWNDFLYSKYKKGGRKWIESSLKQNILPVLATEILGFNHNGNLTAKEGSDEI